MAVAILLSPQAMRVLRSRLSPVSISVEAPHRIMSPPHAMAARRLVAPQRRKYASSCSFLRACHPHGWRGGTCGTRTSGPTVKRSSSWRERRRMIGKTKFSAVCP
jgi:hypothetical protein